MVMDNLFNQLDKFYSSLVTEQTDLEAQKSQAADELAQAMISGDAAEQARLRPLILGLETSLTDVTGRITEFDNFGPAAQYQQAVDFAAAGKPGDAANAFLDVDNLASKVGFVTPPDYVKLLKSIMKHEPSIAPVVDHHIAGLASASDLGAVTRKVHNLSSYVKIGAATLGVGVILALSIGGVAFYQSSKHGNAPEGSKPTAPASPVPPASAVPSASPVPPVGGSQSGGSVVPPASPVPPAAGTAGTGPAAPVSPVVGPFEIGYALPQSLYGGTNGQGKDANLANLAGSIRAHASLFGGRYEGVSSDGLAQLVAGSSKIVFSDSGNKIAVYNASNPAKPQAVITFPDENGIDGVIQSSLQPNFKTVPILASEDYSALLADQKRGREFAATLVGVSIADRKGSVYVNHDPATILAFLAGQTKQYGAAQLEFGLDGKTRILYAGSVDGVPFHTTLTNKAQQDKMLDAVLAR